MYRSPGKIFLPGGQLNTYAAQTIAWRKQFADFFALFLQSTSGNLKLPISTCLDNLRITWQSVSVTPLAILTTESGATHCGWSSRLQAL